MVKGKKLIVYNLFHLKFTKLTIIALQRNFRSMCNMFKSKMIVINCKLREDVKIYVRYITLLDMQII